MSRRIDDYFIKLKPKKSQIDLEILNNFNISPCSVVLIDIMKKPLKKPQSNVKNEPEKNYLICLSPQIPKILKIKEESSCSASKADEDSQNFVKSAEKVAKEVNQKKKVFCQKSPSKLRESGTKNQKSTKKLENSSKNLVKKSQQSSKKCTIKSTCERCGKSFYIGFRFKVHPCTKKCEFCGKIFQHKMSREWHMRQVHKISLFVCDLCGKGFVTKKKLKFHVGNKHLGFQEKNFVCDFDGKKLKNKGKLFNHMKQHQMHVECKICGSKVKPATLNSHIKSVHKSEKCFSCKICQMSFKTVETLNNHKKIHDKKFECKFCGRKFSIKWFLNQHVEANHENPGKFECEICKKKFNLERSYKKHLEVHDKSVAKPFKCTRCGHAFKTNSSLRTHLKYHIRKDEKIAKFRFASKCKLCSAVVKNMNILRAHMKNVHKDDSQFYWCDLCGKRIKFKCNILIHLKGVHKILGI